MSKTVLITGGTRGIGKALVSQCTSLGYSVISTGSSEETVAVAKLSYPNVRWIKCNLSDSESIVKLAEEIRAETLDMVIHNAGVQQTRDLFTPEEGALSVAMETQINFNAPIELTQLLFSHVERVKGTWVYVTSGLAIAPKQSSPIYCANKAGLRAFCKSFNGQIQSTGSDVKVCEAILPLVDTDMTRGRGKGKISAEQAAAEILKGALAGKKEIHIGKMKLVMQARRFFPNLIENIMLKA
ncbi:SDR family NAD(P)-dependent oxidoreductase [Vibrio scophthalmi]|uniref:SDR family NAD(P)-dependent oxidoreductase n=1 Tax=Vibrio scophthalmi TaxID=45658 RepID=UPI0022842B00|nr:SDR family NAD(P)-dependent oxidoreductase [Vibrio scophthalmi]MCY9804239.1 SDR family NAD(P)-dependent oxidoreductase [Vibrio scophthalmi]